MSASKVDEEPMDVDEEPEKEYKLQRQFNLLNAKHQPDRELKTELNNTVLQMLSTSSVTST